MNMPDRVRMVWMGQQASTAVPQISRFIILLQIVLVKHF
jgi:hypothetical protein